MYPKRPLTLIRAVISSFAGAALLATAVPALADESPSLAEITAIAEEAFICALPLVMNYAVMYEFAVDPNGSQFKGAFNELHDTHNVATPADTAVITPNSDTPFSMCWLDLRAEPMVISVPAVDKPAPNDTIIS